VFLWKEKDTKDIISTISYVVIIHKIAMSDSVVQLPKSLF
jgi:hypothetical protein